ncbi:3-ketoacyl-CoA thiolase [Striga asiatica]|uniref:3-ketoacyl-CoA thiolase n=1 Tax=Striga asiatica TaxID=4170 RepID=A0A5A7P6W0_STRAF|nr:3-ketoacyl-CoA thiolase [Striga asiatica]
MWDRISWKREKLKEMRAIGVFGPMFILLLSFVSLHEVSLSMGDGSSMLPVVELGNVKTMIMVDESRRKLSSFAVCSTCMCCGSGGGRNYCMLTACCYTINCNIPNRPFGLCSFTPKTCNCFQCHI